MSEWKKSGNAHIPPIGRVGLVSNKNDQHVGAAFCTDILYPLSSIVKRSAI